MFHFFLFYIIFGVTQQFWRLLQNFFSHVEIYIKLLSNTILMISSRDTFIYRQVHFLITKLCMKKISKTLPQIFKGASNSSNIGCDRNISLDFRHSPLISFSESCTFFPGREPRTKIKVLDIKFNLRMVLNS